MSASNHPLSRTAPKRRLLCLLLASLLAAPALADTGDAAGSPTLPTVTVQASKRAEQLDQMAVAANVVDHAALQRAHVESTADLPRVLPGMRMDASGSLLFSVVTLRGVTSAQDFYNPALTVYVDGVPQLPIFAWQTLLDVEQVELLRGPQGTLYGKSAEGGVLNLVTRQPGPAAHLHLEAGISSRGGSVLQAAGSAPLVQGLLYGGFALVDDDRPGDLRNGLTGKRHQGGAHTRAGRATLRLAPSDAPWEASVNVARDCTRAEQDLYVPFGDLHSRVGYIYPGMPAASADPYMRRCTDSQSLTGQYRFDDWHLSAMAAHQSADIARRFSIGPYDSWQPEQWNQNVQELRLASQAPGRRWDGVFGLYHQALTQDRRYLNALPAYGLDALDSRSHNTSAALAAYADLTWHSTAALDLSAGVRFSHDKADIRFQGSTLNYTTYGQDAFAGSSSTDGNTTLGHLSASYRLDAQWRLYANLAQGYKPGGYNLAPSSVADAQAFERERSNSYEFGANYASATLRGRLSLYQVDTDNVQLYRGDAASGTQNLRNVGDSRARGAEFELQWDPSQAWTLALDGQATDATFRSYDDPVYCAGCQGNRVPYVPRYTLSGSVVGHFASAIGLFEPRLAARRIGALYFDTANTLQQQAYAVVDASLGWRPLPPLQVTAYVDNLNNRHYRTYAFDNTTLGAYAQLALRRTIGLTVAYDF